MKNALPLFFRWLCRGVALALASGCLTASAEWVDVHSWQPITADGYAPLVRIQTQAAKFRAVISVSIGDPIGAGGGLALRQRGPDNEVTDTLYDDAFYSYPSDPSPVTTAEFDVIPGGSLHLVVFSGESEIDEHVVTPSPHGWADQTYGVTFVLPANTTDRAQLYIARQPAVGSVGSYVHQAGAPEYEWYIGGLVGGGEDYVVTLYLVTGGFVSGPTGANDFVEPGNPYGHPPTQYVTATTTAPGMEPYPGGAGATTTATASTSTAGGAATSIQITSVATPTHPGQSTPSGTGGATKADIEGIGNQIATAVNSADTRNVEGVNKMLQGILAAANAVDYLTAITQAEWSKQAERDALLLAAVGGEETEDQAAARSAAASESAAAGAAAGTAAQSQYGAATGGTHTALGYTVGAGTAPDLTVTMPAEFGGKTFDLNPFTESRLGPVASWFKAAVAWLVVVTIGAWVWNELDIKAYQASQAQQAKGNPIVGGTGAQVTALTAAAALTTATVGLATALLGWSFGEITLPSIITAMGTNPTSTMPSGVLWMLNNILPVATIITALVARLAWKLYCVPLFAGAMAVCRFVVP